MPNKRAHSPSEPPKPSNLFKSSPIQDRSSTFIAVFSPTYSPQALQSLPDFKNASHRMTAWRRRGTQQQLSLDPQQQQRPSIFETGYDDDGENYGGKTLEKVLREKDVEGAVMVARWYGGIMLGPVRFQHIRDCACEAIAAGARKVRETEDKGEEGRRAAKRAKEVDEGEKRRLIGVLEERDQSIGVLRGLLAEKKRELEGSSSQQKSSSSPSKGANYATMEVTVLARLEQVRDKTIGWILAQIEDVEGQQLDESKRTMEGTRKVGVTDPGTLSVEKDNNASTRGRDTGSKGPLATEFEERTTGIGG